MNCENIPTTPITEIDELLKREEEQLIEVEKHLMRSKEITTHMFSLLDNFHLRLTELENDILPVYSSTEKTRGLFKSKFYKIPH